MMDKSRKSKARAYERIEELAELIVSEEKQAAENATKTLFSRVIEPLNDSFADNDRDTYYEIFSCLIQFIRRSPKARAIDDQLKEFGLMTGQDLINRVKKFFAPPKADIALRKSVGKVFVLSRVTIGADIAVTSIMIERLKKVFPNARIVFIGDKKLHELFGQDKCIHILPFKYKRRGDLIARLNSWLEVLAVIKNETRGTDPGENVIIDPKSRITQLGLLPLVKGDKGYYFFEPIKRSAKNNRITRLAEDANEWLDEIFAETAGEHLYPGVKIPDRYMRAARGFFQDLGLDKKLAVTINFGVGGNNKKRLSDEFEFAVIMHLIGKGATVILDKGFGNDEINRVNKIINELRAHDKIIVEVKEDLSFDKETVAVPGPQLITYEGGIGQFAGLISQSQVYLGYDSMGQHLAAALGIPELVIFNGQPSEKFLQKWHPYGRGPIMVIDAKGKPAAEVLEKTKEYFASLFLAAPGGRALFL